MRTKKTICLGLLVSILSLLSCSDKDSVEIFGTISGKVTDVATGEPLNAAIVTLIPSSSTIQTSTDGAFSFSNLEQGQYTVSVQKDGFQANRKNVSVINGEETRIVITLTVIPK